MGQKTNALRKTFAIFACFVVPLIPANIHWLSEKFRRVTGCDDTPPHLPNLIDPCRLAGIVRVPNFSSQFECSLRRALLSEMKMTFMLSVSKKLFFEIKSKNK
jgi:hypothetical protein